MFVSSLHFALLAKLKIWQTTKTYSPQTFSVTAAVVAPAVVICLNSLLMDRAKCIPWTTAQRKNEEPRVTNDLKANDYPRNFIKSVDQPNNTQPKPPEYPKPYASIRYVKGVSQRIRRILNRENIKTAFKQLTTLGDVFKKPKDRSTKERLKRIVHKVSCRTCPCKLERVKEVGSLGGLSTSLERMGMSAPR